jgi:uncharacterized protein DUF268
MSNGNNDFGSSSLGRPEPYDAVKNSLLGMHHALDLEYSRMAKAFGDYSYNESCLRKDGTRPGYKFSDYLQSKYLWQNKVMMDYYNKRNVPDQASGERVTSDLRARFATAGWTDVLERDNPASFQRADRALVLTDDVYDAIRRVLKGEPPAGNSNFAKFFAQKCAGPIGDLMRNPIVPSIRTFVKPGLDVLVLGSVVPLWECLVLEAGARPTVANPIGIAIDSDRVAHVAWSDLPSKAAAFDIVIAPFTVGRAGLGAWGEEVAPDGDRTAIAMIKDLLRAEGMLITSIARGPATVLYNSMRVYDQPRLSALLDGWTIVDDTQQLVSPYAFPLSEELLLPSGRVSFQGLVLRPLRG